MKNDSSQPHDRRQPDGETGGDIRPRVCFTGWGDTFQAASSQALRLREHPAVVTATVVRHEPGGLWGVLYTCTGEARDQWVIPCACDDCTGLTTDLAQLRTTTRP